MSIRTTSFVSSNNTDLLERVTTIFLEQQHTRKLQNTEKNMLSNYFCSSHAVDQPNRGCQLYLQVLIHTILFKSCFSFATKLWIETIIKSRI